MSNWTMEQWRVLAAIGADLATSIAVIVAGVWTYQLFVKNRERYPRSELAQVATLLKLEDRSTLLRVQIRVANTGRVLLPIEDLECRLLQVLPLIGSVKNRFDAGRPLLVEGEQIVSWPMLSERTWHYPKGRSEIEPGETEVFCCDFVVDQSISCVRLYSHLANQLKGASMGWTCTTDLDLVQGAAGAESPEA